MDTNETTPKQPSGFVRFLRVLLRLIVVVFLGTALGAAVYFGALTLYTNYVQAVQYNDVRITNLQSQQQQTDQQTTQRLNDFSDRLQSLEVQNDNNKSQMDELSGQISTLETAQVEATVLPEQLSILRSTADSLQSGLGQSERVYSALSTQVAALGVNASQDRQAVQALEAEWNSNQSPVAAMQQELQLVKVMELLTRSRMFLAQNNLGLAQQNIQASGALLRDLRTQVPDAYQTSLETIIAQLNEAENSLPDKPVLATDRIDIAWNMLLQGFSTTPSPALQIQSSTSASPTASTTVEATITPTPTFTPTPVPTEPAITLTPTP